MEEWEHLCGDKAYVGISSIICPFKLKRDRWLTEGEARANKFLQLVRSPSRAFTDFESSNTARTEKW
jgi:hypothetical protein